MITITRVWDFSRGKLFHSLVWFIILWPGLSILAAARMLGEQPLTGIVRWPVRVSGLTATAVHLWPELLGSAIILILGDLVFWGCLSGVTRARRPRWIAWIEPPLFLFLLWTGIVIVYPAALRHPFYRLLADLPIFVIVLILVLVGCTASTRLGWLISRRKGPSLLYAVASIGLVTVVALITAIPVRSDSEAMRESILLLGLDSVSVLQDLSNLRSMAEDPSWTWYENAVTPGLLTNSVWPAILMNRPVHETGCFLIFQKPNWDRSSYNMVEEAESAGYETWSFFSDQFTTYVGSQGGFDVDRSGPKGWLQASTSVYKDATIVMPVLLARLPELPFARTPRNQSGTFSFDLAREIDDIVTAGEGRPKVFVAAHLDYLHQPAYPGLHELSREEAWRVLSARARDVRDLSLHWMYPPMEGEPLDLYTWKFRRIQRVVAERLAARGVLEPGRANRIVIFSDHGPRIGVTTDDFARKHAYNVLFVTKGTNARDPREPISLLDLHQLVGLPDLSRPEPATPVIEYTNVQGSEENLILMRSAQLKSDGEVAIHPYIAARFGQRLLAFYPLESRRGYVPVPSVPAEMDSLETSPFELD